MHCSSNCFSQVQYQGNLFSLLYFVHFYFWLKCLHRIVALVRFGDFYCVLRWEFIKENKKVRKQEKKELDQESDQVKKNSTKKAIPIILSCFLDRFLFFFFTWSLSWSSPSCFFFLFSCFLL